MKNRFIPFLLISIFLYGCSETQIGSDVVTQTPAPVVSGVPEKLQDGSVSTMDDETYLRAYPIAYGEGFSYGDELLRHISFTIGDDTYRLGDHVEYYTKTGWKIKKNVSVAKDGIDELTHEGYKGSLLIGVYNPEETPVSTEDCYVFRVSSKAQETEGLPVFLPGGFTWGSTITDILDVYGKPDEEFNIHELVMHTYNRGALTLTLGYADEKLSSIWFESKTPK